MIGGALVIVESWFTALAFLHRGRWTGVRAAGRSSSPRSSPGSLGLGWRPR